MYKANCENFLKKTKTAESTIFEYTNLKQVALFDAAVTDHFCILKNVNQAV